MAASIKGVDKLRARLAAMVANAKPEAVGKALLAWGLMVLSKSQRLVPVATGRLRASGFVRLEGSGAKQTVVVGYGTDYALAVHERIEARHPHGQAKFLQVVIEQEKPRAAAFLAQQFKGKGGGS